MHKSPDFPIPTELAVGSELAQAIGTAQGAATSGDPPMVGFGVGVHQYLSQLTVVIYSKTTTLLAANMVLVSLLLSTRTSVKISLEGFYVGALCFFSLAAMTSATVLFPRFHRHDASGLIFWRAILSDGSPEGYYSRVAELNKAKVEEEYAKDNYHIAKTLRVKDALLRYAIMLFILGLVCSVIGVVLPTVLGLK